jgi:hypothetical protein
MTDNGNSPTKQNADSSKVYKVEQGTVAVGKHSEREQSLGVMVT